VLVHTGQHHDDTLSAVFFAELGLAAPDRELDIAGGTNVSQLARMLEALEPLPRELDVDGVLVYGDTNSTLAGALAGVGAGVPVIHVEAGMRSWDMAMAEERNRVLTDQISALLLCSSQTAAANLRAEGVHGVAHTVGDVMVDVALRWQEAMPSVEGVLAELGVVEGDYLLATIHRAENVDDQERLAAVVALLERLPGEVVFPMHPRTRTRLDQAGLLERVQAIAHVHVSEPLSYLQFGALLRGAQAVLTDSGGIQKEAYLAGVRCVTLRERTEWVETVERGWNTLAGVDPEAVLAALERPFPADHPSLWGDGHAAERCVREIDAFFEPGAAAERVD
jgi:UDP-N-acetylglucosamine 2-epimerase (non-hydrolysing)/UDP-GlcNAc3NAcA epimerase